MTWVSSFGRVLVCTALVLTSACSTAPNFNDAGAVEVLVSNPDGKPVRTAGVTFRARDADVPVLDIGTQTNDPGRHVHDQFIPGDYDVIAEAPGFRRAVVQVTVKPHGQVTVPVVLRRR